MIFQIVARALPCVFPSNLHFVLPRTAGWLLRRRRSAASLPLTRSYYGHTSSLFDVDEGNEILRELLPEGAGEAEVRRRWLELMRRMRASAAAPFVAKNVGAYDRVSRLARAVPELRVLELRRETSEVVASELAAYRELGAFNPVPAALAEVDCDRDPLDFACRQIVEIERVIDREMASVDGDRRLSWRYEEFCARPLDHLEQLAGALDLEAGALAREAVPAELRASRRADSTTAAVTQARRIDRTLQALARRPAAATEMGRVRFA